MIRNRRATRVGPSVTGGANNGRVPPDRASGLGGGRRGPSGRAFLQSRDAHQPDELALTANGQRCQGQKDVFNASWKRGVRRAFVAAIALCLTMLPQTPALSAARGFDPDDAPANTLDIQASTRGIVQDAQGRIWLKVTIRAYEPLGLFWDARGWLDSRGGARADYRLHMFWLDQEGRGCVLRSTPQWPHSVTKGKFAQLSETTSHVASCRWLLSSVEHSKPIRWTLRSVDPNSGKTTDRAPDERWYP